MKYLRTFENISNDDVKNKIFKASEKYRQSLAS